MSNETNIINKHLENVDYSKLNWMEAKSTLCYTEYEFDNTVSSPFKVSLGILSNICNELECVYTHLGFIKTKYTWNSCRGNISDYDIKILRKCGWFLSNGVWCMS